MDLASDKHIKKIKCKLDDDEPRNGMESLQPDIALDIFSRLPITSLLQFSSVNRSWQMLQYDPNLASLHFSRTAKNNPCLIFHCDYPIRNQLFFVELSDEMDNEIVRRIQTPFCDTMPEFNVIASCNGLLCLSDSLYSDPLYIYNPFTRKHRELPKSRQFDDQEVVFGFGFHPVTNEYKRASEALVCGRLHWLAQLRICRGTRIHRDVAIVSFDLADEQFREVPRPECGNLIMANYQLTVLGGCLSAVACHLYDRYEIWVMEEYSVKESWLKKYNIKDCIRQFMKPEFQRPYGIWKNVLNQRIARVLCIFENGNILMEYRGGVLVSHNPNSGTYKKLMFEGMPDLFQTVVHVGSLNWIGKPIHSSTN
ncbi:F-box protein [Camellia lanceoleosa]|uniref:F-box protein n=1 Tax=Camellia lanceoleosa TaxID=1840588 RepID=A0ACC0GZ31_9ERIC|nr:F-box protein [Camellia lanceoleosa]